MVNVIALPRSSFKPSALARGEIGAVALGATFFVVDFVGLVGAGFFVVGMLESILSKKGAGL